MSYFGTPNPLKIENETGDELDVNITDEDGNSAAIVGPDSDQLKVSDVSVNSLMCSVLKELKKMNLHLSMMTGEDVEQEDVEV